MKCPCDCGRSVPLTKRGAAKALSALEPAFELLMGLNIQLTVEGKDATKVGNLLDRGERLEANLKAHVHREARPTTHPDLLALAQERPVLVGNQRCRAGDSSWRSWADSGNTLSADNPPRPDRQPAPLGAAPELR